MRAMVIPESGYKLVAADLPMPHLSPDEVRLLVHACGVCQTDLHILDGELKAPRYPLLPGHQIVGIVERSGSNVDHLKSGQRGGVPRLGGTCGNCCYCTKNMENLCDHTVFIGYTRNAGYSDYTVARAKFCFPL